MDTFVEQAGAYIRYSQHCTSGPTVRNGCCRRAFFRLSVRCPHASMACEPLHGGGPWPVRPHTTLPCDVRPSDARPARPSTVLLSPVSSPLGVSRRRPLRGRLRARCPSQRSRRRRRRQPCCPHDSGESPWRNGARATHRRGGGTGPIRRQWRVAHSWSGRRSSGPSAERYPGAAWIANVVDRAGVGAWARSRRETGGAAQRWRGQRKVITVDSGGHGRV